MALTLIDRFARWLAKRDQRARTICASCRSEPISIRVEGSPGYCSMECAEADAMEQADAI